MDSIRFILFCNAQEVINSINRAEDWILRNFVKDIDEVSKYFVLISFSYASMKFNGVAHSLTKLDFE